MNAKFIFILHQMAMPLCFSQRVNLKGSYRRRVVHALPKCHITSDVKIVEKFYRYMKPAEYHVR